ncbi:AfsR/SARP family transcriptional regulator [Allostreptomyces psammosilenae]|uniref:DNA-binding SARP family transcriptional activator n=1 Tax=Allostreptomyces psammosilenae TaxID=1892865 RepID=A0A852ZZ03_9ACTN|nr:AfsR/SARP family transcriptional regulator [Allostreptomyces psammosilenae]NYI07613.1 DNA-binding SARP family transcriptional activator [Allostreptomyces psammosilenae]
MTRGYFRVLGPLEVDVDGRRIALPTGNQRTLLATLLLNANEVVPVESLVEQVWGDDLPRQPRGALQTCLTRLRHSLDRHGRDLSRAISTSAAGYVIEVGSDRLDLLRFRELVQRARRAEERGDLAAESDCLTEALALWRGPVLPEVRSDWLHRGVVSRLTEKQLWVLERRNEIDLSLGRHKELVGELRAAICAHPFRERLWQQLMLALYRSGRQAEALHAYQQLSARLREELGIDPGVELRRLHTAILRSDPALGARGRCAACRMPRWSGGGRENPASSA